MLETLRARLGSPAVTTMLERPSQLPRQRNEVLSTLVPLDSINRRLDDMLSMSFDPHIINYEPLRGFVVPKITMYDGTSDLFNHIMHFRQLMTLDIGIDVQSLSGQPTRTSSLLVPPFSTEFREHFSRCHESLCRPLPMFRLPKAEHKHSVEHQVVGERVAQRLHEVVRASSAPSEILQYGCHSRMKISVITDISVLRFYGYIGGYFGKKYRQT